MSELVQTDITDRELGMIVDCINYSGSGLPGHNLFQLVAKLYQNNVALQLKHNQTLNDLGDLHNERIELTRKLEESRTYDFREQPTSNVACPDSVIRRIE